MKRLLALLCSLALVFCLVPSTAFASGGNGNIDGGGGGMGQGTSSNFWNPGNDGVRITVVDAASGAAVSSPLDFSNRTQKSSILHFGKVNKLQYLSGTGLSLQSGVAYSCIKPAQSMPTIVSSKGQSNIDAIKRYFCSEYACMMVAQAAGVDYERMIAGEYKLLIEPIAYFTHNGQYYCMTATEAGLYDQMSGGNLRRTMTSLTHKNLPLSMFLEFSDLGISAWTGNTRTGHTRRRRSVWPAAICSRRSAGAPRPSHPGRHGSRRRWCHRAAASLPGYCFFFSSYSTIRFFNSLNRIFRSFWILDRDRPRSEAISRSLSWRE